MEDTLEGIREELEFALGENALLADGFDEAIIGYVCQATRQPVALYDREKCIQILMGRDGMDREGAEEFFEFNVQDAWCGEGTPAFAVLLKE